MSVGDKIMEKEKQLKPLFCGNQGNHGSQDEAKGLSRRDFVKATSLGALGIGLISSTLAGLGLGSEAEAARGRGRGHGRGMGRGMGNGMERGSDKLFFGLSWTLTAIPDESQILECELRSHLDDAGLFHDLLHIRHRVVAGIQRNPDCDQVLSDATGERLFPADARLVLDLETDLQLNGPEGTPIGMHRGDFMLVSDSRGLLARGDIEGTDGLDPHLAGADRCKAAGHDEGCLEGQLLQRQGSSEMNNAEIRASFSSHIDPANLSSDFCQAVQADPTTNPWRHWAANLDGVIVGHHGPKQEHERGSREREHEQEIEQEHQMEREHGAENEPRGRGAENEPPRGENESRGRGAENEPPKGND